MLGIEDASSSLSVHRLNMLLDGAKALLEFGRSSRGRKGVDGFVDLFVSCVCVSRVPLGKHEIIFNLGFFRCVGS